MRKIVIIGLVSLFFISCTSEKNKNSFSLITWNAHAFFDGRCDGTEFSGYLEADGYTKAVYEKRIKNTVLFISSNFADADVIILEEIESRAVLIDLLEEGLKRRGYIYYGLADDGSGKLSVGFISKQPPVYSALHGIDGSRLIPELRFLVNGEIITVIGIHASSRLSDENEEKRINELSVVSEVLENAEGVKVLIGDINIDPRYPDRAISSADDPLSLESSLVVTGDGGRAKPGVYYTPVLDRMENLGDGTYFYKGDWYFYDYPIISEEAFDWVGWEYSSMEIIRPFEAMDMNKLPLGFDLSTCSGYSDHFAVKLTLEYN